MARVAVVLALGRKLFLTRLQAHRESREAGAGGGVSPAGWAAPGGLRKILEHAMQKLLISGFPKETSEGEIRGALESAGVPVKAILIERQGSEERPIALVEVDTDRNGMRVLTERLDGLVWKGHRLRAEHTLLFD